MIRKVRLSLASLLVKNTNKGVKQMYDYLWKFVQYELGGVLEMNSKTKKSNTLQ